MQSCRFRFVARVAQVFLNKSWAQMNIELDQRLVADAAKAVDLAGFDDEYVTRARLELFPLTFQSPRPCCTNWISS